MKTARRMLNLTAVVATALFLLSLVRADDPPPTPLQPGQPGAPGHTGSQAIHLPTPGRVPADPGDPADSYPFGPAHTTGRTGTNSPFDIIASNPQNNGGGAKRGDPLAGYIIFPIQDLTVTNAYGSVVLQGKDKGHRIPKTADDALADQPVGRGGYDVVANGGFTAGGIHPVVPVMRHGVLDYDGDGVTRLRGGVAVLDDGRIVVARQTGGAEADIQSAFGTADHKVVDFMGGGALIIESGEAVDSDDLGGRQKFGGRPRQGDPGFGAEQFHSARHTLVGIKGGQAFLILSPNRRCVPLPNDSTVPNVQSDLLAAGYSAVVKFDGGAGFYFRSADGRRDVRGLDSLGLCIHIVK